MRILLHICCAPCSTEVIKRLSTDYKVTGFFYNPNIHPVREFVLRLKEFERFAGEIGLESKIGPYEMKRWFELTRNFKDEPEGGRRCEVCFEMRLEKTAQEALRDGFDLFATTLSISPHKDASLIDRLGEEVGKKVGVRYLAADFKKKDGFLRSVELSKAHGLHRQDYCGCVYSCLEKRLKKGS